MGSMWRKNSNFMPTEHTLIANSGIQIMTFPLTINSQEKFKLWFHEWFDSEQGIWCLEPAYLLRTDDGERFFYSKNQNT